MEQPYISNIPSKTISQTRFGGINLANGTPLGEWEQLSNMDFSAYPAIKTCAPFSRTPLPEGITGYTFRGGELVYTVSDGIYTGGVKTALTLSEGEKTLVSMGAYIIILPDFIAVNTAANPITAEYGGQECSITGNLIEVNTNITSPYVDLHKDLYLQFDVDSEVSAKMSAFSKGDRVLLSWTDGGTAHSGYFTFLRFDVSGVNSTAQAKAVFDTDGLDTTYFYIAESYSGGVTAHNAQGAVMSKPPVPDMDFVVEHNNRLWGCSSKNHEIYCSSLGKPLCWGEYAGISTDSWAASVGTDGDFTAAAVYGNSVLFFKENCVHIVYGTKASNFTVSTISLRGVQKGSHRSLCQSGGLLYYKAPEGIYAFNGSSSAKVDARLGADISDTAVGTADDRYIIMITAGGTAYIYTCVHDCWYTRPLENAVSAHSINGRLYAITRDSGGDMAQVQLTGRHDGGNYDAETAFSAVSGSIGRGEVFGYIKKLRMSLEERQTHPDTAVSFALFVSCDKGEWQEVYSSDGSCDPADGNTLVIAPVIPLRCHSVKLKLSGTLSGSESSDPPSLTLYGIYLDREEGSEIGGKH